ncbi:TlyA family RNA methyltransferase [Metamycoplasma hyosynoviae]|uniref:TlyA family RNA methyltransferase n=1 Tax=Metamycoplasma hyosynoviae TaxID=29559 RepID=UPI002359E5D6|nr:TlyA family RNA methyltransferase [Metamycoplasma hyosynoviae]MDC8900908.1 TlyA family RNA methyltransferase [Metamycoplasma hyosynoviae]MDC8912408.1 TlyA family RNA methyltransferase [Metamycoplasma hyosynoviae]MDC8912800.1 TlyA family RNA methyltransferase [Metamycoplasma hyosynoviae]MDC8914893.1 TlyA family RNA methyltransferase [Metamycoplasma hyosynoviae]MDD1374685.1 TlyA family RNA methyltransferase [Metamycoplasma hyosynoviae]
MTKKIIDILKTRYPEIDEKVFQSLIMQGKVFANGNKVLLKTETYKEEVKIEITENIFEKKYVSRGAYKLLEAIGLFNIEIEDKVCLDIGSSTGGFVQVLLENNAKKIYAVDVGTNQLDYSLRIIDKIKVYEKTNLKDLNKSYFQEEIDFISCDVSFISLKYVFKVASPLLSSGKKIMVLIKPQFEAPSKLVEPGGYVNEIHHEEIINKIKLIASENEFKFLNIAKSPIKGFKSKNIEYITLFERK